MTLVKANYHYYNATGALQALEYQQEMIDQQRLEYNNFKNRKKMPLLGHEWIDET